MARGPARPGREPGQFLPQWAGWLLALALLGIAAAVVSQWMAAHRRPAGVEVYFVVRGTGRTGSLVPVRRPAPAGPTEVRLQAALRALLDGPHDGRLHTEIPQGTAFLGVAVRDGVVTVDVSPTFASGGGSTSMLGRVWQVVYTATQFPDAPAVQILINGRRVEALGGEGILIGAPLRRPEVPPSF